MMTMRKTLAILAVAIILAGLVAATGSPAVALLLVCVGAAPLAVVLVALPERRLAPVRIPLRLCSPDRAPPRRRQA